MSALHEMPLFLPDRLEGGTQNIPGIAGLLEGIRFVRRIGTDRIAAHERNLVQILIAEMQKMPEIRLFAAQDTSCQTGVLSFLINGVDCERAADAFARRGIALRAGLHCAPLAHKTMGTFDTGTLRISTSAFSSEQEMRLFLAKLKEIFRRKRWA